MITAKILADSRNTHARLTTFELTYPRFIHSELMTHRMFSRNAASSRAIPIERVIEAVESNPAMPVEWGSNKPGMQAGPPLSYGMERTAKGIWIEAAHAAAMHANRLQHAGVHKQITNRLLEPFMHMTTLVTATEWDNFFSLRAHPDAQPEFRELAYAMQIAMFASEPERHNWAFPHCPLTPDAEELLKVYDSFDIMMISAGRCARVSYLTHSGERSPEADLTLAERLLESRHMSPFEHVATSGTNTWSGNFYGWNQFRKEIE